jgi:hypothetical protein
MAAAYAFTLFRLRLGPSFDRLLPASAPTYDEPSSETTASSKISTKGVANLTIEDKRSARSSPSL